MGDRRTLSDGDRIALADLVFRFIDDTRHLALSRLRVVAGVHRGKIFRIEEREALIGRATDNDVQFPDRTVSRHHCRIRQREQAWWIEDLGSTNGTLLRGAPVLAPQQLRDGDEIVAGFTRFVFLAADGAATDLNTEPPSPWK